VIVELIRASIRALRSSTRGDFVFRLRRLDLEGINMPVRVVCVSPETDSPIMYV